MEYFVVELRAGAVQVYIEKGEEVDNGLYYRIQNIDELNKVLETTATSWKERV